MAAFSQDIQPIPSFYGLNTTNYANSDYYNDYYNHYYNYYYNFPGNYAYNENQQTQCFDAYSYADNAAYRSAPTDQQPVQLTKNMAADSNNQSERNQQLESKLNLLAACRRAYSIYPNVKTAKDEGYRQLVEEIFEGCPTLSIENKKDLSKVKRIVTKHFHYRKKRESCSAFCGVREEVPKLPTEKLLNQVVNIAEVESASEEELNAGAYFCLRYGETPVAKGWISEYPYIHIDKETGKAGEKAGYAKIAVQKKKRNSKVEVMPFSCDTRKWVGIGAGMFIVWPVKDLVDEAYFDHKVIKEKNLAENEMIEENENELENDFTMITRQEEEDTQEEEEEDSDILNFGRIEDQERLHDITLEVVDEEATAILDTGILLLDEEENEEDLEVTLINTTPESPVVQHEEEINNVLNTAMIETEEEDKFKPNTFVRASVLVEGPRKKVTERDFVAQIMDRKGDCLHLKYMVEESKNVYFWPSKEDKSWEPVTCIKDILVDPVLDLIRSSNRKQMFNF